MLSFLSSIRLTFITLAAMMGFMLTGIILTTFPEYRKVIMSMNHSIALDWLLAHARQHWGTALWLMGICLAAVLLFLNTLLCTVTRQLLPALKINSFRRWSFLILHCLFLLVLACHGLSLVAGDKQENITLFPGQSLVVSDNFQIHLTGVSYQADPELLAMDLQTSRSLMTRKAYDRHSNTATLDLYQDRTLLASGTVFMLNPLRTKGIQVTLTAFSLGKEDHDGEIGVTLTLSRNPLTPFFFTAYALMIITLVCFIIITWNPKLQEDFNGTPRTA